jgi:Fe-Mn family superoxide dismutase
MNTGIDRSPTFLRELSVASMTGIPQPMAPAMDLALSASFGSVERWREAFVALGRATNDSAGWLLLSFQPSDGRLVNHRATDDTPATAASVPLLALDAASAETWMAKIDWTRVYERYQDAVTRTSEGLGATADEAARTRMLDVRRAGVFERSDLMAEGAQWCDPARVAAWAAQLPKGEPVTVYCVYGHEVGRSTAMRLRAAGIDARFLIGGFDGWQAQGRPLVAKR